MGDNLLFYLTKLSHVIVAQSFETSSSDFSRKKNERFFKKCVKRLKQKGCDVLLKKADGCHIEDPCVTDYGGNWSPLTLLADYRRELECLRAEKASDLLMSSVNVLKEKPYYCVDEMLKLLLLMKKPLDKEPLEQFQSELSFTSSGFFLNPIDSVAFCSEDFSRDDLTKTISFKKALRYEESWTKHFEPKFQLLGECSRKNLLTSDKFSIKSFMSKPAVMNLSHSGTNSFIFTDFFQAKNYASDKSLFDFYSCVTLGEAPLLDTFVDQPISHKLPPIRLHSKNLYKSGFVDLYSTSGSDGKPLNERTESENENSRKHSGIELKRNSNCSHSFSILYKKSGNSEHSSFGSNESVLDVRSKRRETMSDYGTSKDIILGLWEQEQMLIKEFRPELALNFPTLRMISLVEFVEDVKYLFTGINSGTFCYNADTGCFDMVYGTCLDDVTPESLFHFSKDFMEIGNCYLKLSSCVSHMGKNSFDTCTTTSQAFWKSISDYLELHYSLVLEISVFTNLMSLKSCTEDLREIIVTVANICKVYEPDESLPEGGKLLTYLLQVAEKLNKQCVINIVFGILQNCCNVYFMCILQNWMFKGQLNSQCDEFFVDCRQQKIKAKCRAYYNSFFVVEANVPSFLKGYEDAIFNCGKSIHFLKLFDAENKFCQLLDKTDYPSMRLCFTRDQLNNLETDFTTYEENVISMCGEKTTIRTIRKEEEEKEKTEMEYVKECKKLQEIQREKKQRREIEEAKEKRKKQNVELREQRNLIDAAIEKRKREEKAENLKVEENRKRSEEARERLLNQEKDMLKNYYNQLEETLDERIIVAENKKKILTEILSQETLLDVINDNEIQVDNEGNISVDLNSNENSETVVKVVECPEQIDLASCLRKHVELDENLNPTTETGKEIRKSVSHRTVAADEAQRNKCKVLRSEFGFPVRPPPTPEKKPRELTALEKNRRRVLESEYNILLKTPENLSSLVSLPKTSNSGQVQSRESLKPLGVFQTIGLERKQSCLDLEDPPEKKLECAGSESFESLSLLTVQNETSAETVKSGEIQTPETSSGMLNESYQNALVRDAEIFRNRFSHQTIFCSLKEEELDNLPCTDFMSFQRFLRKSALIPLRVQEKLANDALLKHILKDENVLSHLRSLRSYFFLNDGEFGRSFTQHAFRSLSKCTEPQEFFERSNLSNILNEAINYTIHNFEANSQNLSFRIVKMPPFVNHSSHDVLSPFELSYKVDWPLNVIITEKALSKYKMVFRFLLKLKRINWTLNENFLYFSWHFKSKKLKGKILAGSSHYHKIQIYRHAMIQVMITLDDYIFSNGIQFPWICFLKDLESTQNIDDLYQKHVRYIKDVLTRCFLSKNSEDLLDYIHNLIELALKFHYTSKSCAMESVGGKYVHPKFTVLKTTFSEFCSVIKTFLKTLRDKICANQVMRSHYVLIEKFDLKLT